MATSASRKSTGNFGKRFPRDPRPREIDFQRSRAASRGHDPSFVNLRAPESEERRRQREAFVRDLKKVADLLIKKAA